MIPLSSAHSYWPFPPFVVHAESNQALAMNDSTDELAIPFQIPVAGTLTHVAVDISTFTSNITIDGRLETVGTDGNPSASLFDANGTGSLAITALGIKQVPINSGTGITVAFADEMFFRWKRNGAAGASTFHVGNSIATQWGWPCVLDFNITGAGAWTKAGFTPVIALKISGVWYTPIGCVPPFTTSTSEAFQTAAERGILINSPIPITVIGAWSYIQLGAASTVKYTLYSDPTGTPTQVVATHAHDSDAWQSAAVRFWPEMFTAPVDLAPNTNYVLAVSPQGAVNMTLRYMSDGGFLSGSLTPTGASAFWQSRASGANVFAADTTRVPLMGLIITGAGLPIETSGMSGGLI